MVSDQEMQRVGFSEEDIAKYKKKREEHLALKQTQTQTQLKPTGVTFQFGVSDEKKKYYELIEKLCKSSVIKLSVSSFQIKNSGQKDMYASYTVDVNANVDGVQQSWSVFRRFTQFHDLMTTMLDLNLPFVIPPKTTSINVNPQFLEERRLIFDDFVKLLVTVPISIFTNPHLAFAFAKFFSPVQIGDQKPSGFIQVFPINPPDSF